VHSATIGYRLVRGVIRLLLWLFYRRIDVIGREHVPTDGPVIVAANHHNAVVDGMLVIAVVPRPVMVLAKAPLFRHPLIGPFLRMMGAVPVNRRLEAGDDPRKNEAMFEAGIAALRAGGGLLIFPEGRTQPQPLLLPVRTGAARLLLGAETAPGGPSGVALLPVGMVFRDAGTFRSASVQITIGAPVATADVIALYRERPEDAVRTLTDRLAAAIRERIVEAEDHHTLALLTVLEHAWDAERGHDATASDEGRARSLAWKQEVMRAARYLSDRQPHRVAALRQRVELYRAHLDEVGMTSRQLGRPYTAALVARYVVENFLWLMLGLPLALVGLAAHAAPYWLTDRAVRWLRRTAEEEATDKMAAGLVLYPLLWAVETWMLWSVAGRAAAVTFLVLLVPSGLLALAWQERLGAVARQARAFVSFLTDRDLHRRLLEERRALVADLRALADMVPPEAREQHAR
jgi:glycerol-3-phosphate O-acyltransferase / dihydroxyacetone phosphate acyltransferase